MAVYIKEMTAELGEGVEGGPGSSSAAWPQPLHQVENHWS